MDLSSLCTGYMSLGIHVSVNLILRKINDGIEELWSEQVLLQHLNDRTDKRRRNHLDHCTQRDQKGSLFDGCPNCVSSLPPLKRVGHQFKLASLKLNSP